MSLPNRALVDWLLQTLKANPLTLTELDLLRGWHKQQEEVVAIRQPYELFQQHFVMRNALYHLRRDIRAHYFLDMGLLYIRLHPASKADSQIAHTDALADYYLDERNLTGETPDSVMAMLEAFFSQWQRFEQADVAKAKQTLELDSHATLAQAKQQYRNLANIHHPDKGGDAQKFNQVQQAYQILKQALS